MVRTVRFALLGVVMTLIATLAVTAQQPPKKDGGKGDGEGKGKFEGKGKGGFGQGGNFAGAMRVKPGTVMPVFLQDSLKMTDEQKKEMESLQKMVDEKLAKILTEDQQKQLKEMGERGPGGGFGRGGPGGPGGGPGGRGGPPKKDN